MKDKILHPVTMFLLGGLLGVCSKLLDLYDTVQHFGMTLGDMFSELSIWILLGVLISIYSQTKWKAVCNVFPFCIGMLAAYYITAELTHAVYGWSFIKGWAAFACLSPLFAALTWMTKEKGWLPKLISLGILIVAIGADIVVFGGPRIYDFVILLLLIYFLFFAKVQRRPEE